MAITSQMYDGPAYEADEVGWAGLSGSLVADYGVRGLDGAPDEGAGRVTVVSSAERTVAVAPGIFYGRGVLDRSDSTVNVQLPIVAAGQACWFLVAVRRDWQANVSVVAAVPDPQTSRVIPSQRETSPGVRDDQPLALVQITGGQSIPTSVIDLRCWAGNAGLVVADKLALTYLDRLGSRVAHAGRIWERAFDGQGSPAWFMRSSWHGRGTADITVPAGSAVVRTYSLPEGMFADAPICQVSIDSQSANSGLLLATLGPITKDSVQVVIRNFGQGPNFGTVQLSAFPRG